MQVGMLQSRWVDSQVGKKLVILYMEASDKRDTGEFYTMACSVSFFSSDLEVEYTLACRKHQTGETSWYA